MNELLKKLRVDVIDYVYGSTNPDVDYDVEADQVLEILDEISGIEVLTELHEVCDSMRGAFVNFLREDNVLVAYSLQNILHTLKDLETCHEVLNCFTRATINWRRGLSTFSETISDYEQIYRDRVHKTRTFTDVHEYTWTEVWDLCHEG